MKIIEMGKWLPQKMANSTNILHPPQNHSLHQVFRASLVQGWLKVKWGSYTGAQGAVLSKRVNNRLKILFRVSMYVLILLEVRTGTITHWVREFKHTFWGFTHWVKDWSTYTWVAPQAYVLTEDRCIHMGGPLGVRTVRKEWNLGLPQNTQGVGLLIKVQVFCYKIMFCEIINYFHSLSLILNKTIVLIRVL